MSPKREEQLRSAGWTVRGELRVASDLKGASDVAASLASRFVLEARGRWKTAVARPANAIGMSMEAGGIESGFHSHVESQLMFQVRGELTCEASNALWIVPPQSALWVPGGVSHRIPRRAPLEGYSVFVDPRRERESSARVLRGIRVDVVSRAPVPTRLASRPI